MRLKTLVLCSTSFGVLALGAAPALAQQPPSPEPPTQEAQTTPAPPEGGPAQADDAVQDATGADDAGGEEIVVTGLAAASNPRRTSSAIRTRSST
jgi:hypothetical protein